MKEFSILLDQAYRRAGIPTPYINGEQIDAALIIANQIYADWVSRGLLLWQIKTEEIPCVSGQSDYELNSSSVEVLNVQRRDANGYEIPMTALNRDQYVNLPNKLFPGGPLQYWQRFSHDKIELILWPVPDSNEFTMVVWTKKYINSVTTVSDITDIPPKWESAMVTDLAYRLMLELPSDQINKDRFQLLKMESEAEFVKALNTESDGTVINLLPNISPYTR
jgi:hypothetical protein